MTIMAVMMAAALPVVSTQVQREREEELIFRGLQYAEGIRLYRKRYGRFPVSLKEMYETRPRTLRKLWKDPMTDSTDWGLVNPGGASQVVLPGRGSGDKGKPPGSDPGPKPLPTPTPSPFGGPSGSPQNLLPVAGVYSKSTKKALRQFQGRDTYSEWQFTEAALFVDRRTGQAIVPGGGTGPGGKPGTGLGGSSGGGPGGSSGGGPGGGGFEIPGTGPGK